jgi:predicted MPP superfamily phosphohydrolase
VTTRKIINRALPALAVVIVTLVALIIYSTLVEPSGFEVNHYRVDFFDGADDSVKLRIALISDLHIASTEQSAFLEKVVDKLNELDVDYIVICGDLVYDKEVEIPLLTPLSNIKDKNHTIVVLGNHDYGLGWHNTSLANELEQWLRLNGFTVLRNENILHQKDEAGVCFVGVDSLWSGQIDLDRAFSNVDPDCKIILLSHNPDVVFMLDGRRTDLMLSGHTHGGQACLPLIGAPWIPSKIKERCGRGFHEINDTRLFITKGIVGTLRFNAKPEIAVIELT